MNMKTSITKLYWNKIGDNYQGSWKGLAKQAMSDRELEIISNYLKLTAPENILDIGVGNGRILNILINDSSKNSKIFGIDISEEMIEYCQKIFKKNKKISKLSICNISKEPLIFKNKFDFVTAVRILKYNKNWRIIIKRVSKILNKNGVFVFTMPNYNSINRFVKHTIPVFRTTVSEIKKILIQNDLKLIKIRSITKIPDFFYNNQLKDNKFYVKFLISIEKLLELLLGKVFLGRMLFIICQKK